MICSDGLFLPLVGPSYTVNLTTTDRMTNVTLPNLVSHRNITDAGPAPKGRQSPLLTAGVISAEPNHLDAETSPN
jgi:hypothetical protein